MLQSLAQSTNSDIDFLFNRTNKEKSGETQKQFHEESNLD